MDYPPPSTPLPGKSCDRADALAVLSRLRAAGHVAYFAGGCVRDLLLGREPKDWDVATDAPPDRVRALFSNTQAVGQAFGVILVRHRRSQVEVATFRSDGRYVDGRRPEAVRFTSAEEDARRRDFTINGLFLDPLDESDGMHGRVIDFVGGRDDLRAGVIRAIGDPAQRFEEDHLRLLRAVRFAARLGFAIDPATAAAIRGHAPMLARISPERVADELRAMLPPPTRIEAWRLLNDLGLASVVFRFADRPAAEPDVGRSIDGLFARVAPGEPVAFPLAMAAAAVQWFWSALPAGTDLRACFERQATGRLVRAVRRALRLSNEECEAIEGALVGVGPLVRDDPPRVATLKRFLARPTAQASRAIMAAAAADGGLDERRTAALLTDLSAIAQTEFAPPPLITGDDLTAAGAVPGPAFKAMLDAAYDAQLEGRAASRDGAMAVAMAVAADSGAVG